MRRSAIFLLLAFASCLDDYEETIREERTSDFSIIRIKSVFTITLARGDSPRVTIVGDNDVVPDITTEISGDTLLLDNTAKGRWLNPERNKIEIFIESPSLNAVFADESYALRTTDTLHVSDFVILNFPTVKISDIQMTIKGNSLFYWNNWLAGGKLDISGKVTSAELHNYALHILDCSELSVQNLFISNFGREDCYVRATHRVTYALGGPGNIILYGNPPERIEQSRTSSGSLILR